MWSYSDGLVLGESQSEVADLNNDGIPEVCVDLRGGFLTLHGNNGSIYWRRTDLGGSAHGGSPIIFDLNGDGYPNIYCITKMNPDPRLWALAYDGTTIASYNEEIYKLCWGGISLMDYDHDGNFEIYLAQWNGGQWAPGSRSYTMSFYASNLTLRWKSYPAGNSFIPQLIDATGDGVRDVITIRGQCRCEGAGCNTVLYVLSAEDGSVLKQSYAGAISECLTPVIYDIDGDGNPEHIGSGAAYDDDNRVTVWDLIDWQLDAEWTLPTGSRNQPRVGDINADGLMEILVPDGGNLRIYNSTYDEISIINCAGSSAVANPMLQDVDGDGYLELIVASIS